MSNRTSTNDDVIRQQQARDLGHSLDQDDEKTSQPKNGKRDSRKDGRSSVTKSTASS